MPELPEVETIVRSLRPFLEGRRLVSVKVHWPGSLHKITPALFVKRLRKARFEMISRRGKYLVFALSQGQERCHMLVHLRMSGRLEFQSKADKVAKHDRLIFEIEGGGRLCFNDTRKFGRVYLAKDCSEITAALGPEPLDDRFDSETFLKGLHQKHVRIKPLLLDQKFLAGVGNIYADESLWRAGIHPRQKSNTLSREKATKLLKAIRFTLNQAIRFHGTDAGDGVVDFGRYSPKVYGRQGEKCPRCRSQIKRIVVAQRGTHFCPRCQPIGRGV